ncbi:hypothetical protein EX30DRAFT_344772 [Ascodesmis nigricans]|uniref:Uncharacterized protein n=1 Tax=Ascodesmis nigricans TaxID=341454 RepID=A0A4S2MIQ7_9PEZI|nr:hypothetical protein EX30DRAFT_344772 [Ascodesmis nigricans]
MLSHKFPFLLLMALTLTLTLTLTTPLPSSKTLNAASPWATPTSSRSAPGRTPSRSKPTHPSAVDDMDDMEGDSGEGEGDEG